MMAKRSPTRGQSSNGTLAVNRKARYDYFIDETMEAGLVLKGVEIKSIRDGRVNLRDSYVVVQNGEAWVRNLHISPYEQASTHDTVDPLRSRKLLLHRRQIRQLEASTSQKGMTIVPLRLYLKNNRAKLEIGIARGKKLYDKRDSIAEREAQRRMDRALRRDY